MIGISLDANSELILSYNSIQTCLVQKKQKKNHLPSTARVCKTLESGGTIWVSQILPPITEPRPIVIRPKIEALE